MPWPSAVVLTAVAKSHAIAADGDLDPDEVAAAIAAAERADGTYWPILVHEFLSSRAPPATAASLIADALGLAERQGWYHFAAVLRGDLATVAQFRGNGVAALASWRTVVSVLDGLAIYEAENACFYALAEGERRRARRWTPLSQSTSRSHSHARPTTRCMRQSCTRVVAHLHRLAGNLANAEHALEIAWHAPAPPATRTFSEGWPSSPAQRSGASGVNLRGQRPSSSRRVGTSGSADSRTSRSALSKSSQPSLSRSANDRTEPISLPPRRGAPSRAQAAHPGVSARCRRPPGERCRHAGQRTRDAAGHHDGQITCHSQRRPALVQRDRPGPTRQRQHPVLTVRGYPHRSVPRSRGDWGQCADRMIGVRSGSSEGARSGHSALTVGANRRAPSRPNRLRFGVTSHAVIAGDRQRRRSRPRLDNSGCPSERTCGAVVVH